MAFVWDASDAQQSETAQYLIRRVRSRSQGWRDVTSVNGLAVLRTRSRTGIDEPCVLHNDAGAVVGTLFERPNPDSDDAPRRARLGPRESAAILSSRGRALTTHYWGSYIAFLADAEAGTTWVIRGPGSFLPCFHVSYCGVTIFFSAAEDCVSLNVLRFAINWDYVAQRVAFGPIAQDGTALHGVSELGAGECVEFRHKRVSRQSYWQLSSVSLVDPLEDPQRAAKELRSAVKACTRAWASCYHAIIHRLSGGLDSSIVLGCLKDMPARPEILCLRYYLPYLTSDERLYARLAAERAGCDLVQNEMGASIRFMDLLRTARSVNPYPHLAFLTTSETEKRLVTERSAQAIFDGEGGDTAFGSITKAHAASDYCHRHGLGSELFAIALQVALQTNSTVWKVAAGAIRDRLFGLGQEATDEILAYRKFVSKHAVEAATRSRGAVLQSASASFKAARGTAIQAGILSRSPGPHDALGDPDDSASPDLVSPLLSQPVVEACVRIPTYRHLDGGRDRGLARRAFAGDVPTEILGRLWKDCPVGSAQRMLLGDIHTVRELLLDGVLAREQMLDPKSLDDMLSGRPSRGNGFISEIFDHLLTEAWLRQWTSDAARSHVTRETVPH